MQHTQIFKAKKEVIDFFSSFGSGTIVSEITKIFDTARHEAGKNWDRDESQHYSVVINAVIYFSASLTQLLIDSSTEDLRSETEKKMYGERLQATPASIDTEAFLSIGKKLLSKFSSTEISDILWECYFEAMVVNGDQSISRSQLSSIGYTLKVVTGIINEMDVLINRVNADSEGVEILSK